jgi:SAM-dependent methyltransferase
MPYTFHTDPKKKWDQQYKVTKNHIVPFLKESIEFNHDLRIMEIGCGEGGVLKAFLEEGCRCYGVDISPTRVENARRFFDEDIQAGKISFFVGDVRDKSQYGDLFGHVDLVVLKDAIEHIFDQVDFLKAVRSFLSPRGYAFLGFPPWPNPFGGHQQLADSFLKYVPWFHLLPRSAYRNTLKLCGENERKIEALLEIYDTGLTIRSFENILKRSGWQTTKRQFYLLNPIYEYKFGIKGRKQFGLIAGIPLLRDFFSTGVYYVVR